jgi:hypothetical protein
MKNSHSSTRIHKKASKTHRWSARVSQHSNALDLKQRLFTYSSPGKIARSLKQSAEKSRRRKGSPYQSAMSMLNFYINRAGKKLPGKQRQVLEKSKNELRRLYHRA